MPPARTFYLSDDDVGIWDSLPDGMRSKLLRDLLIEYEFEHESKPDDEKRRDLLKSQIILYNKQVETALEKYYYWESQLEALEGRRDKLRKQYHQEFGNLVGDIQLSPADIWDTILANAESYAQAGTIFTSPTGRSRYRIQGVKKGKLLVERVDSSSPKPSTFTSRTIQKAVERLNQAGGERIALGHFMPVLAQECAAVELHPNLRYEENWLVYDREAQ